MNEREFERMSADDVQRCAVCSRKAAHSGIFYVLRVDQAVVNQERLRRQAGLEMMLGSPGVAAVMGERDVIDRVRYGTGEAHLCVGCLADPGALMAALDAMTGSDSEPIDDDPDDT